MIELHLFANDHPGLSFLLICGAFVVLIAFAISLSDLGNVGRRTTHVHHHHSEGCRENHEKGPCRGE